MNPVLRSLARSFRHAWRGVLLAFRTERSFRLQLAVGALVLIGAIILPLERWERASLLLAITAVLVLELLNSVVERFADLLKPRLHEYVADIKDLMAGAVLLAASFSVILGLLLFWPYLVPLLQRV